MKNFIFRKDWLYFKCKQFIYLNIVNPWKTMKQLKGVFKPLRCYFSSGKTWKPILWCSNPAWFQIKTSDVDWKDKFDTPRYEGPPYVWIHLYKWNLIWYWDLDLHYDSSEINQYWEQALWYLHYTGTFSQGLISEPDIEKAKKGWPWQDMQGNSTWTDKYLIK